MKRKSVFIRVIRGSPFLDNPRLATRIGLRLLRRGDVAEWLKAAVC
jgi:hypothetical protein